MQELSKIIAFCTTVAVIVKRLCKGGSKMEVILISIFSAIIIFITVYSMIKALNIAYKRKEITVKKLRVLIIASIGIGLLIASSLPFVYQKIYDTFLQPLL